MALSLFFNTAAASSQSALVRSATSTAPSGNRPEFVLGDNQDYNIYLVDGAGNYDAASGAGGYTVKLAIGTPGATPTGGTYTLTYGAYTTSALAYNASASDISTALNALNSNAGPGGDVTVSGTFPNFRIKWDAVGAINTITTTSTSLSPTSSAIISVEQEGDGSTQEIQVLHIQRTPAAYQYTWGTITNGWNARLNCNTFAFRELLGTSTTANTYLELEITDSGGNEYTRAQIPIVIRHEVIDEAALTSTSLPSAISSTDFQNQAVQNRSSITGLTGGGATNLDGIATVSATVGWLLALNTGSGVVLYRLKSGTTAESSPTYIRPDDYATTTNEKYWELQTFSTLGFFTTETVASFSSAGNSDVTLPSNGVHHVAFITASTGAGTYTRTISLLTTNASTGDMIDIRLDMPASVNPTVEIRNASSGGTLLTTAVGDGSTGTVHGYYQYTGSAWVEVGAYWI